jgi:hypothetical protein
MTDESNSLPLTDEQKSQVRGILSVGCDRQTAVDYVGCSLADIRRAMQQDAAFMADVRRAEAGIELMHMRNVQEVAETKKEWRASVWWLEHRSPERFARKVGTMTARQLKAFTAMLLDIYREEVRDAADRERLIARFTRLMETIEQMLADAQPGQPEPGSIGTMKLLTSDMAPYDEEPRDDELVEDGDDTNSTDVSPSGEDAIAAQRRRHLAAGDSPPKDDEV